MSASMVETLVLGLCALGVGGVAVLGFRLHPRLATLGYLAVLMFVPAWLGVSVGVDLSVISLVGLAIVVALFGLDSALPATFDLVLLGFASLSTVMTVVGILDLNSLVQVVAWWVLPYFVARTVASHGRLRNVYDTVAVLIVVVAVLAMVESATSYNIFDSTLGHLGRGAQWSSLQMRGGMVRVEGAFGHSIALGGTLAMSVPLVWASRWPSWYKVVGLGAVAAASFLTFSRIGMISTFMALALCFIFLRSELARRARWVIALVGSVLVAVFVPIVLQVLSNAGGEASQSADFRFFLLKLVPSMAFFGGASSSAVQLRSIDSVIIVVGVHFGIIPLLFLLVCALAGVIALFRRPSPPLVAVAAILPGLTSVSFITQFTAFFWFVTGLGISASTEAARADRSYEGSVAPRPAVA
jgi:hypothetical protein